MSKKTFLFYLISYPVLISLSIGIFFIYRPFAYVDSVKSYIVCNQSKSTFEIGPNFIFAFTDILDEFNDKKARKLCKYGLVKDYADTLKTPGRQNYTFYPIYTTESSWIDAFVISFIAFIFGSTLIGKLLINFFMSLIY